MGRKKGGKNQNCENLLWRISTRITTEENQNILKIINSEKLKKSEVIRNLFRIGLKNYWNK